MIMSDLKKTEFEKTWDMKNIFDIHTHKCQRDFLISVSRDKLQRKENGLSLKLHKEKKYDIWIILHICSVRSYQGMKPVYLVAHNQVKSRPSGQPGPLNRPFTSCL